MWKKCEYTKKQINTAGERIIDQSLSKKEREAYIKIIDSFRAAHAFPMNTFAINLKHKVEDIPEAIVVQRLKRLETILDKLERYPDMKLYRMQDLGGCRVIVPKIEDVYTVVKRLRESSIKHKELIPKDYIAIPNPKTGYRSYHLIYRYYSDKKEDYNGLRTEIQIRTRLQHLWATAVETVGLFTDNKLKFNRGSEKWRRFFKLTSALFAIEEKSAIVEGVPEDIPRLHMEWLKLLEELAVIRTLATISTATKRLGHITKSKKNGYYLLKIDVSKTPPTIEVETFVGIEKGLDLATEAYNKFEREKVSKQVNCVLVSARSYENLVAAYPNYFLDVQEFFDVISKILDNIKEELSRLAQTNKKRK